MPRELIDLTGQRFGKLVVIKEVDRDKHNYRQYLCKCDCGNEKVIRQAALTTGQPPQRSCGCSKGNRLTNEPKKFVKKTNGKCPYPSANCLKRQSRSGICCCICEHKETCSEVCLNSPDKCGLIKKE